MIRPKLLDLYCGVGGAGWGYHLAGFEVTGIDLEDQPHYPCRFIQADAIEFMLKYGWEYDLIHASPPCQAYTVGLNWDTSQKSKHPDLLAPTRAALRSIGVPYVIENVPGAPMYDPITLCGVMFGLYVIRHRRFESNLPLPQPEHVAHRGTVKGGQYLSIAGHGGDSVTRALHHWRDALEIPWGQTHQELANAIPPRYTEWVGQRALELLTANR